MRTMSPPIAFGRAPAPSRPVRLLSIRPALLYGVFSLLVATNAFTAVALLMSPEIARLASGQAETILVAYEDRIAELRLEVDRLHSRHYARTGDINLQLHELALQQEVLSEQQQYVRLLAQKAAELGIETAAVADPPDPIPTATLAAAPRDVEAVGDQVQSMMDETRLALAAISGAATASTDAIVAELTALGLRPRLPQGITEGVGGPLMPPTDGPEEATMLEDANAVMEALVRFKAARGAIELAPVHQPLSGKHRTSSTYGNRRDPFTGGKAFHAGLDFPAPTGTTVLSAGDGKVTFVGTKNGYGKVVEISHAGGLVTRYAHLSAFLVSEGQSVRTGAPIAKVGTSGRSTGPHLHFEVRRDDRPLDPQLFLKAGKRLQSYLA